ncbi:hypothetical protein TrVFT333_010092 [Trichoderma virens FT-333]|nr:hypothetical protein TrVFT333_010092 [Trichoderma virens FT-333]
MPDGGPNKPTQRGDFKIAIVCALQVEYDAVCLLVDEFWDDEDFRRAEGDQNFYTTGHISNHNVVILLLASMGKTSAATAVANMRMSFTAIQLLLLVGICGGVPFPSGPRGKEILLGDVIIGDEVKPYDYGKQKLPTQRPNTLIQEQWRTNFLLQNTATNIINVQHVFAVAVLTTQIQYVKKLLRLHALRRTVIQTKPS